MPDLDDVRRNALALPEASGSTSDANLAWNVRDKLFVTIPPFKGCPAILVQLDVVAPDALEELVLETWLTQAPKKLAKDYLAER